MTREMLVAAAWNLVFAAGVAAVAFGCWMAWKPLGWMVGGLVVALLGYGGGLEQMRKARRR